MFFFNFYFFKLKDLDEVIIPGAVEFGLKCSLEKLWLDWSHRANGGPREYTVFELLFSGSFKLIFYLFIYLFIYFWLCWVFGSCEGFL